MDGTLVASLETRLMYSFGDSTAFPLRDNFLDTLTRTVRSCSSLFSIECEIENAEQQVHQIHKAIGIELARHESLEVALNLAINQVQGTTARQTADQLRRTHMSILLKARQGLIAERDRLIRAAAPLNVPARIRDIVSDLWLGVELPHTQWSYRWRIDDEGKARTQLHAQLRSIASDFIAQPSASSLWNSEIPVSSLVSSLTVQAPIWNRRSKGTQPKREDLAEYSIIELESSKSRQRLLLRRGGKAKHALLITLSDAAQSPPNISLVDERQGALGDSQPISVPELEKLQDLWSLVHEHQAELIDSRQCLSNLCIDNRQLESYEHPSEIAEMLLACIAPLAREIRLRSRVPGELILKRNTGEGRREELFLPRETLQALYEDLPDKFRRVFDAMGLGQESTRELVTLLCDDKERKPLRQRSARVVSSATDARPPPQTQATDLAMNQALADLSADDDADGADVEEMTLNEPTIIVEIEAA